MDLLLTTALGLILNPTDTIEITLPAGFLAYWDLDAVITRESDATYTIAYDPVDDKPAGTSGYISPTGSDSTGDGTSGNPWQSPEKAKTEGVTEIIFKDGWYDRDILQSAEYNFTSDTALVAENTGQVYMGRSNSYSGGSWTQQGAPNTDVYVVSRSAALRVLDHTYRSGTDLYPGGDGYLLGYTKQTSVADCQANPGSYYISGSSVYVHTHDSRAPDSDVKVCLSVNNIVQTNEIDLYIEGIIMYGDTPVRYTQTSANTGKSIAYNAAFVHNAQSDCYDMNDVAISRCMNVVVHDGAHDGFSYHTDNASSHTTRTQALEYNCTAKRFGESGETTRNGSSAHEECKVLRINGTYSDTYGPVIHDVTQARSVNLGVTASNCLTGAADNEDCGFRVADVGSAMWLRDCTTTGPMQYDRVEAGDAAFIDLSGFTGVVSNDNGTIFNGDIDDALLPLTAIVPSTFHDFDFTMSDSYSGSGTSVANLAFLGTPSNYDQTIVGSPTFQGSAGDSAAYLELNGSSYLQQDSNVGDLYRPMGASSASASGPRWIALVVQPVLGATQTWFGNTDGNSARRGIRLVSNTTNNLRFLQRQSSGAQNLEIAPTSTLSATPTVIIITFDTSDAGNEKFWVNSKTGTAWTTSYTPTSDNDLATIPFEFCSAFGTLSLASGTRVYAGAAGEGILSDTDAGLLIDQMNLRHARTYA